VTPERQARQLAVLLEWGTWTATGLIGLGLLLTVAAADGPGLAIIFAGTALFVLLPVLRVIMLGVQFFLKGETRWAAVTGLVLLIIGAGTLLNL